MALTAHEDCVVIVIDAQPGFHPPELPEADKAAAAQALDRAAWLVALATRLEVPVVVTEEEPEDNGPTDPRLAVAPAFVKPTFGLAGNARDPRRVPRTGRPPPSSSASRPTSASTSPRSDCSSTARASSSSRTPRSPRARCTRRGLTRLRDAGARLTHAKALGYEWVRTVEGAAALPRPAPFRL